MTILILPAFVVLLAPSLPRWGFMWAMACALYASAKWLTYRSVSARVPTVNRPLALGYLFAWPGMNANAFLFRARSRWPTPRIGMAGRPPQDRCRRHPDLDRGPYRPAESPARGWLAGYGGPDSRSALRHLSFAVARLAETRRRCFAGHA